MNCTPESSPILPEKGVICSSTAAFEQNNSTAADISLLKDHKHSKSENQEQGR
jgi:hypothetical protein